ncbi:MAG TPA: glycosyltransferase family 4 protein [Gemmatimonadaceae bacterium]|nr:glycosyltransferase family 4 protein [Gemmatimonadaceae bacterium]
MSPADAFESVSTGSADAAATAPSAGSARGERERQGSSRQNTPRLALLFVNQHYWPDVASTGQHLTDLAEHLAAAGHAVEVLCGRGHYLAGNLPAPAAECHNGVLIRRLQTTTFGRGRHLGRIADYASFYVQVLWRLLSGRRRDLVIFLTTPPILPFVGWVARLVRRQRYAIWSMDLHPDAEIAEGMLSPRSPLGRFLRWADQVAYRQADTIVDLGPYMKARIVAKGVDPRRTVTIPVWNRAGEVEPVAAAENPLRRELGLDGKFVVMYSGNAGIVHEFGPVLDAMRILADDPRVFFLFVGGGPRRRQVEAFATANRVGNFRYVDYFPRQQLRWSLAVADAHLISLRREFVGMAVPGKLYGIMAAGRPAVFVGPVASDSGATVVETGCGVVIDPADADAAIRLAELLRGWSRDPAEPARLGSRGRAAFLQDFEQAKNTARFAAEIARAAVASQPSRGVTASQPEPSGR